jgi:hypothetical protein
MLQLVRTRAPLRALVISDDWRLHWSLRDLNTQLLRNLEVRLYGNGDVPFFPTAAAPCFLRVPGVDKLHTSKTAAAA